MLDFNTLIDNYIDMLENTEIKISKQNRELIATALKAQKAKNSMLETRCALYESRIEALQKLATELYARL